MSDSAETYVVITANLLRQGTIVYLNVEDGAAKWTDDIKAASVLPADGAAARLDDAGNDQGVVGAYAAEIAAGHAPISARERIRAQGPTVKYGHDALAPEDPDFSI